MSFNVAGYFFDLPHDFCTLFAVEYDNLIYTESRERQHEDLVVLRQYRFLKNLRTFNFMQNKKRLIANILKVKTFD